MALEIYSLKSRSAEWIVVTFCKVISFNCLQINCFLFNKRTIPFWLESIFSRIITLKSDSILKEGKKNWLSLKFWLPMHLYQISEPFFAYGTIHRLNPMNKLINFRLLGFKKKFGSHQLKRDSFRMLESELLPSSYFTMDIEGREAIKG